MSTADEIRRELAALDAERDRLNVVDGVLTDMLHAATQVAATKDYGNDEAEKNNLRHWDSTAGSVWADQSETWTRWHETHDRLFAEITKARSDIQARHASQQRSQGRERSR
ncbi:hypothetical protein [Nocardia sp. NPDC127526]|uniref:hypothetical protein n=1 Tax=Nocardia sp. NPDC127526 TaxID=3345393 RepID=UPI00363AB85A